MLKHDNKNDLRYLNISEDTFQFRSYKGVVFEGQEDAMGLQEDLFPAALRPLCRHRRRPQLEWLITP